MIGNQLNSVKLQRRMSSRISSRLESMFSRRLLILRQILFRFSCLLFAVLSTYSWSSEMLMDSIGDAGGVTNTLFRYLSEMLRMIDESTFTMVGTWLESSRESSAFRCSNSVSLGISSSSRLMFSRRMPSFMVFTFEIRSATSLK